MNNIIKNFYDDCDYILDYYNYLVDKTKRLEYVGITNEWLLDNIYVLLEHKNNIIHDKKKIRKLIKSSNNIYYCLKQVLINYNYNVNINVLVNSLKDYQKDNKYIFSYDELSSVIYLLIFLYTDRLRNLCQKEFDSLKIGEKVESDLKRCIEHKEDVELKDIIDSNMLNSNTYIFELNNKLRYDKNLFRELNNYLEEKDVSIREMVNDYYSLDIDKDILISNIFNNLKDLFKLNNEELFEKVSKVEKLLLQDDIYPYMTDDTKDLYRIRLKKLANKNKVNQYEYLKKIISKDKHIGFYLFKDNNNDFRSLLYIFVVFVFSLFFSIILSKYFIHNRIIGTLLLYIPIRQIVVQLVNRFLLNVCKSVPICKIDYSKGLDNSVKTMCVIPTIVSSREKVKEMFNRLENFYLINKSSNLYFTLLGDVKASSVEVESYDKDIMEYGEEYAKKLNKKYGKELFYFIYRKRIYNTHEGYYLGYERKRGALVHFNQILLGKLSSEDNKKYFNVNDLFNKNLNIKYVITLDQDTSLVLNTALNLVGAMNHPLNHPVLNAEGTRVVSGYGLMQPRVGVDIESTNGSLYSQIFAGIGGFDTYSSLVPDVFQDYLSEGSFIGKGIYDLEMYDKLLSKAFPDNLILSHDLLEGNYLRCGYVGDVELIDDFPESFLVDVTRQHRWARGDVQIISWLMNKVRNKDGAIINNPISIFGKYKIFDNIVRMFLNPSMLIVLVLALCFDYINSYIFFGLIILEISLPVVFFLNGKVRSNEKNKTNVYYKNLYFGFKSLILRSYVVFSCIPYYTKMYLDAVIRTIYRLCVSHKNLLNWVTAEDASKSQDNSLFSYVRSFWFNTLFSIIFVVIGIFTGDIIAYIISIIFLIAPIVLYFVSKPIDHEPVRLKDKQMDKLNKLALSTWRYFEDNLNEDNNYLIPDNYQENRENKADFRTSPTALGYSLVAVICADEMDYINKDSAIFLISKIIKNIISLEKWHGHLYNWYNIKTKEVIFPRFVSSVDSGNFVACLIVVREYLEKNREFELLEKVDRLINNTNFKKLYCKDNVFSIGYDDNEAKLVNYNYNKFASESRLLSYVAICLGDVPYKHWFCLDKSLTTYKKHKGLISWSGTAFEYYMPFLFMRNYPNTLTDETYSFVRFCQKDFVSGISRKLPWGISESAYDELDNSLNYKYKAFGVPYLKAKEEKNQKIVLSAYSSIMALELFPQDVYENIEKFYELDMNGKYGLYEAFDYDTNMPVKSFFAHHQGMILVGLCNYLNNDIIKNYFSDNIKMKTFEILLKEKVQVKTSIDLKMDKYKKYNYNKEKIENDIRAFNYISYMPEVSVLYNKKYCLLVNDRGNSFSRYRTCQLNRYRKVTEQDYGLFLFIKDLDSGNVWSNTYAPINVKPDKYEVVFASDKIKFLRFDGDISTKTEIIVTHNHHAEIRRVTFKNESDKIKRLELTSYTEPILSDNMDDISHRVYNNMFLSMNYDSETNSIIVKRKNREQGLVNAYMVNKLVIDNPLSEYTYEKERVNFIGRGHTINNPVGLNNVLSSQDGDCLDPVVVIRNQIEIDPYEETSIYMIQAFGRSIEQIREIINSYSDTKVIDDTFRVSALMNIINTKSLNITGGEMRLFNIMLNYLYQTTKISINDSRVELLRKNSLSQAGLWKFGISGDRPIVVVEINDISDIIVVKELLKAFEYYKNNSIFIDLVIINGENDESEKLVKKEVEDEKYRMYTLNNFYNTPGSITCISNSEISKEEKILLYMVPRLLFKINNHESLEDLVDKLQKENRVNEPKEVKFLESVACKKEKLEFDNGYGGFKNKGREYVIYNKDTPKPWSNIIANKYFGSIITNNGCGYTYAYNSSEFKISSWTNEMINNDKSEGFRFNGKEMVVDNVTHGFGYSILSQNTSKFLIEVSEFIPLNDNVKVYIMNLKNTTSNKLSLDIEYWINPTLGNFEERTARHILSEFMGKDNYLKLRNVYSIDYSDVVVFLSSSEKINSCIIDSILSKAVNVHVNLESNENKSIIFTLGATKSINELGDLLNKYSNVSNCRKELKHVKDYWENILGTIEVKSQDKAFDYVINGWYLYQTISSRIFAKAGFYQVSGAFGYRDQLQDSTNIACVLPEQTKSQILINASHQFIEGDVLHWWHEKNRFGLRSRYKDDFLWLVYSTLYYIDVTGDVDILKEEVPYINSDKLSKYDNEKTVVFTYSNTKESLFMHLQRSLSFSMNNMGKHGLPLMGGGDWNDGMNKVGIKGKGESVWLGFFLYLIIDKFIDTIKKYGIDLDLDEYIDFNSNLKDNLNKNAWDGKYYLRAYFDNQDKLGSSDNSECKIDLISQSFAILSKVADKKRANEVINEVEENLVDDNLKIIKLLAPPFSKSLNNPGYIMNYPKGIRENGGQYTHGVAWYLMALIKTGYYDRAYRYFQMINPINRSLDKKNVMKYQVEPYVIVADIYSSSLFPAQGGWTWYTGSAGWFYKVGIVDILGLHKHADKLEIIPRMPISWDKYEVCYHYMDTIYNIYVSKANKDEIRLDDILMNNNIIVLVDDKKTHRVDVKIQSHVK